MSEILLLSLTAGSVAMVHTLLGPDHYLPFVAMAKSRGWSLARTLRMTLYCGCGHIVGSVMLGVIGVAIGSQLSSLNWIESVRGDVAAWALLALGLVYFAWGLRHAYKNRSDIEHGVMHGHHHIKATGDHEATSVRRTPGAYWALFIVFILGPCEPLIPLLMYPAAIGNVWGAVIVSSVFALVTVVTMVIAVMVSVWGLSFIKMPNFERYAHALAGSTILMCGASMVFLGL